MDGRSRSTPGVHGENSSAAMPNRAKFVTPGLRSSCKMSLITACCVPHSSVTALSSARGSSGTVPELLPLLLSVLSVEPPCCCTPAGPVLLLLSRIAVVRAASSTGAS